MDYIDIPSNNENSFVSGEESIGQAIYNIFVIRKGSVPGNPEFGTNLGKFLFEQLDPLVSGLVKAEVLYALKRWEPRIHVTDTQVIEDSDYNRIIIKLKYNILDDPNRIEREFIFNSSNLEI